MDLVTYDFKLDFDIVPQKQLDNNKEFPPHIKSDLQNNPTAFHLKGFFYFGLNNSVEEKKIILINLQCVIQMLVPINT